MPRACLARRVRPCLCRRDSSFREQGFSERSPFCAVAGRAKAGDRSQLPASDDAHAPRGRRSVFAKRARLGNGGVRQTVRCWTPAKAGCRACRSRVDSLPKQSNGLAAASVIQLARTEPGAAMLARGHGDGAGRPCQYRRAVPTAASPPLQHHCQFSAQHAAATVFTSAWQRPQMTAAGYACAARTLADKVSSAISPVNARNTELRSRRAREFRRAAAHSQPGDRGQPADRAPRLVIAVARDIGIIRHGQPRARFSGGDGGAFGKFN